MATDKICTFYKKVVNGMAVKNKHINSTERGVSSSRVGCTIPRDSVSGRFETSANHTRKYGEVRPEVQEMVKRRLNKHASTWTELAKR